MLDELLPLLNVDLDALVSLARSTTLIEWLLQRDRSHRGLSDHYPLPVAAEGEPVLHFDIQVPEELEVGVYSNFVSVWHSPHEFTLDFSVTMPGSPSADGAAIDVPCRVVARVKLPTTTVEDVLRALAENVTMYERNAGPIRKPGGDEPTFPPEDLAP